jgi:hypothetical protein
MSFSPAMTTFTRIVILACAVVLVGSATATYTVQRQRAQQANAARAAALATARAPAPLAKRVTCDSLLTARKAMLGRGFEVAAADVYRGPPAAVDFTGHPEARASRTRLREAMNRGVNFGGRYLVASWSCGTNCQRHAIVDAMTGAIVAFGLDTEMGVQYSLRSRLLVTNPKKNVPPPDSADMNPLEVALTYSRIPREYYEVIEGNASSYLSRVCVESAYEGEASY